MNLHDNKREESVSLVKAALAQEHGIAERHRLDKGDLPGHPFRGNQYRSGNEGYGFHGEAYNWLKAAGEKGDLTEAAHRAFADRVKMLVSEGHFQDGGQAREFLDSTLGRHYADALTSSAEYNYNTQNFDVLPHTVPTNDRAKATIREYLRRTAKKSDSPGDLDKGDLPGHPFRGNQYKDGDAAPDTPRIGGPTGRLDGRALGEQGKYPVSSQFGLPKKGDWADFYDSNGDKQYGQVLRAGPSVITFRHPSTSGIVTLGLVHEVTGKKVG